MNVRVYVLAFAMLNCLAAAGYAQAKKEADAKPQPPPSALRGNVVPHCEPGNYPAGNICKPSPPGTYSPAETTFPIYCPQGKSSPSGARSRSECR